MNTMSGDEKEKDVNSGSNSEDAKNNQDLEDTLSRFLRQKGDVDNDASNEGDSGD